MEKEQKKLIIILILLVIIVTGLTFYCVSLFITSDKKETSKIDESSSTVYTNFEKVVVETPEPFSIIEFLNSNIKKVNITTADKMINEALNINRGYISESTAPELFNLINSKYDEPVNEIDNLNNLTNISDPEVLDMVTKYHNIGYEFYSAEGSYWVDINYQFYIDNYGKYLSNEVKAYLALKEDMTTNKIAEDGGLLISFDELAVRIIDIESFIDNYEDSIYYDEIENMYHNYLTFYFFGMDNTLTYDDQTSKVKNEVIDSYNKTIKLYPKSYLTTILNSYLPDLKDNNYILSDSIRTMLNNLIK